MSVDPLASAIRLASTALDNQSTRMRVVAENLANAQSAGDAPGAAPYRRKTVTFAEVALGATGPRVSIGRDGSELPMRHDPAHPAADANGMVRMPNVQPLVEAADMREASRAYEANVEVMRQARDLIHATIDLMRSR